MALSSFKGKLVREKINGALTIQLSVNITNAQVVLQLCSLHLDIIGGSIVNKLPFTQNTFL